MSYHIRCLAAFVLAATSAAYSSAQDSFPEPIGFDFEGELIEVEIFGQTRTVNASTRSYIGGPNFDSISFTSLDDLLLIRRGEEQIVQDVEVYFLGPGDDVLLLSDDTFVLPQLTVLGNTGNDIIFGNVEDDVILGEGGNDLILGEGGNDRLRGGDNNDILAGGEGNDSLDGGAGNDDLFGGPGADAFIAGLGQDLIFEEPGTELNTIHLQVGLTFNDLTFQVEGEDLRIFYAGMGDVLIFDQFVSPEHGIDQIILNNGEGAVFDLRAFFVPEPSTVLLAVVSFGFAGVRRRDN